MKHHKNSLRSLFLGAVFSLSAFVGSAQSNGFEVLKNLELMDLIYQHLDMYYVDDPQPGMMGKTAIDAMLKELDPYTVYYHESNMEDYRLMTTGQYGGIGSLVRQIRLAGIPSRRGCFLTRRHSRTTRPRRVR